MRGTRGSLPSNRGDRGPARPGLLPALRPQAVGRRTALPAAGHALRGRRAAPPRPRRGALRRDARRPRRRSGRGARPRAAARRRRSTRTTSTTCRKMCLLPHARGGARDDRGGARGAAATVVVAGSDATDHAERVPRGRRRLRCCVGEGEATLLRADRRARRRPARRRCATCAGLACRARDGGVVAHAAAAGPARTSTRCRSRPGTWSTSSATGAIWRARHGYFSMNMATTRGCPFHCNWCAKPIWGQRYDVRSPRERGRGDGAGCKRAYAPDHIWFVDDIFGLQPGLAGGVRRRGRGARARALPFKCLWRADLLGERRGGRRCARAGCRTVWIGAESGSQRDPRRDGEGHARRADPRGRARACARRASRSASSCSSATRARRARTSSRRARWCASAARTTSASRCPTRCRARRFYERVEAELGAKQNWDDSDDLAMLYRGPVPDRRSTASCTASCTPSSALRRLREPPRGSGARQRAARAVSRGHAACLDERRLAPARRARPHEGIRARCRSRSTPQRPRSRASRRRVP